MVRCACGSRSTRHTRLPSSASAAPRLTVVVVFPTPPFWFITAMVRMSGRLRGRAAGDHVRVRACDYRGGGRENKDKTRAALPRALSGPLSPERGGEG